MNLLQEILPLFENDGFYIEEYKKTIIFAIEKTYNNEVLKTYCIIDIIQNNDKFLIKWQKRYLPLSDEEVIKKYR